MDNVDWHARFLVQASWTGQLRQYLYQQIGINKQFRILEVGCGTGVITSEMANFTDQPPLGMDINFNRVEIAAMQFKQPRFSCSDVYHLPFPSRSMDFVAFHFLFLWLNDPLTALHEILRVLKPGGTAAALAEPDYLARMDSPRELWRLGEMQTQALIKQGVNPMIGRQLPEIFNRAGLIDVQYGVSGFQSPSREIPDWFESEWKVIRNDLATLLSAQELEKYYELDRASRSSGSRVLWIPTFYAFGKKCAN